MHDDSDPEVIFLDDENVYLDHTPPAGTGRNRCADNGDRLHRDGERPNTVATSKAMPMRQRAKALLVPKSKAKAKGKAKPKLPRFPAAPWHGKG